jgi:hypothetical protein
MKIAQSVVRLMFSFETETPVVHAGPARRHCADRAVDHVQRCRWCQGVLLDQRQTAAHRRIYFPMMAHVIVKGDILMVAPRGFDDLVPICTARVN